MTEELELKLLGMVFLCYCQSGFLFCFYMLENEVNILPGLNTNVIGIGGIILKLSHFNLWICDFTHDERSTKKHQFSKT